MTTGVSIKNDQKTVLKDWKTRFERYGFFFDKAQEERNLRLARIGLFIALSLLSLGAAAEIVFLGYICMRLFI